MDIAEKIMAIKTEIIDEVKQENDEEIKKKRDELKKKYERFQQNLEEKQQDILNSYQSRADQKREQIVSRAILERKNKRRIKLNDCINDFLSELRNKLEKFTEEKEYYLFIFNSLKRAAQELPDKEFVVLLRKNDENLKFDLENLLHLEMEDYEFEIKITDKIKSGGFIIKTKNSQQLLENTFSALINSYQEEIAIELKNNILEKKQ